MVASLAADYDNGLLKLIVEDKGRGNDDRMMKTTSKLGAFERLSNAATRVGFRIRIVHRAAYCGDMLGLKRLERKRGKAASPVEI